MDYSRKFINILIDYDNLELSNVRDTKSIIDYLTYRLFSKRLELSRDDQYVVTVRLYGGWYMENILTRKAQDLSSHLQQEYPDYNEKLNCTINVELSRSLASRPSSDLLFTYRKREGLGRVFVCKNDDICCTNATTSIKYFKKLKRNGKCPHCQIDSSDIIWVSEQKLVDVMLAMDISHFSTFEKEAILVVVSSDDDFIPAIFQMCYLGKQIFHMHAKPGRRIRQEYRSIAPTTNYVEIDFKEMPHE